MTPTPSPPSHRKLCKKPSPWDLIPPSKIPASAKYKFPSKEFYNNPLLFQQKQKQRYSAQFYSYKGSDGVGGASPLIMFFYVELCKSDNFGFSNVVDALERDVRFSSTVPLFRPFLIKENGGWYKRKNEDYTYLVKEYQRPFIGPAPNHSNRFRVKEYYIGRAYIKTEPLTKDSKKKDYEKEFNYRWYEYHGIDRHE